MVRCALLVPAVAGFFGLAAGHARVFGIAVNGVDQGAGTGTYIRQPPNNSPVKDTTSSSIICNVANTPASKSVDVKPGDKIDIEWFHDNRGDDIIDGSHKGPVLTYLASADSNGVGGVWTKIAEQGLFADGTWAVDKLIANKGKHSITIPEGLAPGEYLLRDEIIALHEGEVSVTENPARGAQFYPSCIQIKVGGSGSKSLTGDFDFVKGYSTAPTNQGIVFNVYRSLAGVNYPIPGPAVLASGSGSGNTSASTTAAAAATTTAPVASSTVSPPAPIGTNTSSIRVTGHPSGFATVTRSATAAPAAAPTAIPDEDLPECDD